jgi:hypothetical protein
VEGHLRTGHSVEAKRSLVERIVEAVAQAAAIAEEPRVGSSGGYAGDSDRRVRSRGARARRRGGLD